MFIVIVVFQIEQPITHAKARKLFVGTAPKYQHMQGPLRKPTFVPELDGR